MPRIQRVCPCCGLANGSTTRTSTVSATSCVTRAWVFYSTIQQGLFFVRAASKLMDYCCLCDGLWSNNYDFSIKKNRNLQYIERDGGEYLYTLQSYPEWLQKKITLLKYFRDYMSQHLLKVSSSSSIVINANTSSCWFIFVILPSCHHSRLEPPLHPVQVMKCHVCLFWEHGYAPETQLFCTFPMAQYK
jgi:hypothetical protein